MKRKILSILLALCLALTLLPVAAFATEDSAPAEPQEQKVVVDPEVKQEADPEQQPEQPEGQPEEPEQQEEAKPAEEKEAQEPAPQPAQSEGKPVVLSGEGGNTPLNGTASEVSSAADLVSAMADPTVSTVKLTSDISISERINIINRTVTIDLNGHVIQGNGSNIIFYISNGHLTLNDSDPEKLHKFTTGSPWVLNENDGTEIVKGGVITGGKAPAFDFMTGGVFVDSGASFTMNGGNIVGCSAYNSTGSDGAGGVYNNGTFTMNGGSIRGCLSSGLFFGCGGVYNDRAGTMIANGGRISDCNGYTSALYNNGTVRADAGAALTVFEGSVENRNNIEDSAKCSVTFDLADGSGNVTTQRVLRGQTVSQPGNPARDGYEFLGWFINGAAYDFIKPVTETTLTLTAQWSVKLSGSGTKESPYQIGTADGLKWFRDKVNAAKKIKDTNICAVLTKDIVLDATENWEPIGKDLSAGVGTYPYTGTFDGNGHTISGLNVTDNDTYAGLFGYVCGGTIKNLTVAGNVSTTSSGAGGIAGGADGGTFENCANLCDVKGGITGGIIGFVNNINYKLIVRDCYNAGKITSTTGNSVGGIIGSCPGTAPSTISNCYNVGEVTKEVGGVGRAGAIVGSNYATVNNCYYLDVAGLNAFGNNYGTLTDVKDKSAKEFADGTVLALLKAGERGSNADPWADACQYVTAAGKTLPVFKGQGDAHSHVWGAWTSNGDGTHTRACACGVTETGKCSGGTATRTARAVCQFCGQPYGQLASGGIRRQPTGGSGAANTSDTTKTVKSGNTGDMGVMLYAGMALLSLTGGAWIVGKKRK